MCSVLAAGIDKYTFILLSSDVLPLVFLLYFLLFHFFCKVFDVYMFVIASYK